MKYLFLFGALFLFSCSAKKPTAIVEPITVSGLQKLIKERNGKPLFLNLWAAWCKPCVEEFPHLSEAEKKYGGKIDFVAVSLDDIEDKDLKVQPFVIEQKVYFKVFIADIQSQDSLFKLLDPYFTGSIPTSILFDKDGSNADYIVGEQSKESFEKFINRFLNRTQK